MTKNEIIENIASTNGLSKVACEKIVDSFIDEMKNCLVRGDKIVLKNFMSFEVVERAERDGRNPQSGKIMTFPAVKSMKCKPSKALKDAINAK